MLRGNLMRGGIAVLVVAVLWTPAVWALSPLQSSPSDGPEATSVPLDDPGWIGWLLEVVRSVLDADEGEGGGDVDPNGQPSGTSCTAGCSPSGSGGSTTTTSTPPEP